jgi:hypothetical protein
MISLDEEMYQQEMEPAPMIKTGKISEREVVAAAIIASERARRAIIPKLPPFTFRDRQHGKANNKIMQALSTMAEVTTEALSAASGVSAPILLMIESEQPGVNLRDAVKLLLSQRVAESVTSGIDPLPFAQAIVTIGELDLGGIAVGEQAWPDPTPIPKGLSPVLPLDPVLIPPPLHTWLMDIADRMQIPPDFSVAAAFVALGSVIGRGCGVHPKQRDNWLVVPNLWGACVGRPSMMKTPSMAEVFKILDRLEIIASEEYQQALSLHEFDTVVDKAGKKRIEDAVSKALKGNDTAEIDRLRSAFIADGGTPAPFRRRYFTSETTPEKICELANQNPRGFMLKRDELIGWLKGLDRDGRENLRSLFLEAWNGTGRYSYDTVTKGTIDAEALCLSVFGAITPGRLSDYVYQAVRGGAGDDGLIQRFQMIVWPDAPEEWQMIDRWPDTQAKNAAFEIFKVLSGDIPGAVMLEGNDIPVLRFSEGGQAESELDK